MEQKFIIGIDFGTDSCRALVVDASTGKEIAAHTAFYPRWKQNLYCEPSQNQYRQHPQDYIDSLTEVIRRTVSQLSEEKIKNIVAIGIDTTGSTPCLTDKEGTPLALLPEFSEDPDAMFILWKDHTSIEEAEEINKLARSWETDFTSRSGGIYSSEWFWAKALHLIRKNKTIRSKAYSVIEHCDWMPALLTGNLKPENVKRSRCAAGHKGMWAAEWGGYPEKEFLSKLDPMLADFGVRMDQETYTSDCSAGKITGEWAQKLGLHSGIDVSVGILDAHAGAIGAGIKVNTMVKIIGTSTCDIVVIDKKDLGNDLISGISGQVDGSVIPDLIGLEAGQSAFGDVYAWWKEVLSWSLNLLPESQKTQIAMQILPRLTIEAEQLPLTESDPVALDWLNGRRTPFADFRLKGAVTGVTLATTPAQIFKSLVEATAFGSRLIMEHLEQSGVVLEEVIAVGGIPLKSPYVMQVLSDVMGLDIKVAATMQAGALGSAMCAAVAAGIFNSLECALETMGQGYNTIFKPCGKNRKTYDVLYANYRKLEML